MKNTVFVNGKEIKALHAEAKAYVDWEARGNKIANSINGEVSFVTNPLRIPPLGYVPQIHVYEGIEKLAEVLGAEDRLKTVPFGTDDEEGWYDIQKEFEKDGVVYFQLETSEERKEELAREMTEGTR